jgi:hypothetical protein
MPRKVKHLSLANTCGALELTIEQSAVVAIREAITVTEPDAAFL